MIKRMKNVKNSQCSLWNIWVSSYQFVCFCYLQLVLVIMAIAVRLMIFLLSVFTEPSIGCIFYFLEWIRCTHFKIAFHFSLPWNQHTIIGWIAEILLCLYIAFPYVAYNYGFLTFFVVIGEFHRAFYLQFQNMIENMNLTAKRNGSQKAHLCDIIRYHNSVKRYFKYFFYHFHSKKWISNSEFSVYFRKQQICTVKLSWFNWFTVLFLWLAVYSNWNWYVVGCRIFSVN